MKKNMCTGGGVITGKATFNSGEGASLLIGPVSDIDEIKLTMKNVGGVVVYYGPTTEITTENSMTLDPKEVATVTLGSGDSLYVLAPPANGLGAIRVYASIL